MSHYDEPVTDERPRADAISSFLGSATSWADVRVVETTGSTNADLAARAREGADAWTALVSMEQTNGRGRLGRAWSSPPGGSLSLSVLLRPAVSTSRWAWLSLLAGMAVADAISQGAPDGVRVQLKWPNDVLIDGGKVCGILAERIEGDQPSAVVGIGVNVSLTREELPVSGATSLALAGCDTNQSRIVARVLSRIERYVHDWQRDGDLRDAYTQRCASIGTALTVHQDAQRRIHGIGAGVDEAGRLLVDTSQGRRVFAVGDVVHATLT